MAVSPGSSIAVPRAEVELETGFVESGTYAGVEFNYRLG
jgi:hypothetical protein